MPHAAPPRSVVARVPPRRGRPLLTRASTGDTQRQVWLSLLWKILKETEIPDHLTCLLRNLYAGQEATVRTRHGTMDWFQIGKGVNQGCILSPCLFNLYAEYIMRNAGLNEPQAGRNTNNLRYAGNTILTAESKDELKSLLMKRRVKKLT